MSTKEEQIKEMISQGKKWNEVSKELHVSPRTIAKVLRRDRTDRIITLAEQGKTWKEIAKELHISFRDISDVLGMRSRSEIFKEFERGVSPIEIVIEHDVNPVIVRDWFRAWLEMKEMTRAHDAEAPSKQTG